jgi:hypothetical protein
MQCHCGKQKPPISCAYAHSLCVIGVKRRKNKPDETKKTKKDQI